MNPDGSPKVIVSDCRCRGIASDVKPGSSMDNMGSSPSANDGSIDAPISHGQATPAKVHRPKRCFHVHAEADPARSEKRQVYWCDREGMRVCDCRSRRLSLETLSRGHPGVAERIGAIRQVVGRIPIDPKAKKVLDPQRSGPRQSGGLSRRARDYPVLRPPPTARNSECSSITAGTTISARNMRETGFLLTTARSTAANR